MKINIKKFFRDKVKQGKGLQTLMQINSNNYWTAEEEEFILKGYGLNKTPKQIHRAYMTKPEFNPRTHFAISSFLDEKRRNGIIGKQRIDWDLKSTKNSFEFLWIRERENRVTV